MSKEIKIVNNDTEMILLAESGKIYIMEEGEYNPYARIISQIDQIKTNGKTITIYAWENDIDGVDSIVPFEYEVALKHYKNEKEVEELVGEIIEEIESYSYK